MFTSVLAPLRPAPPLGQSTEEILAELRRHAEPTDDAGRPQSGFCTHPRAAALSS